MKKSLRLLTLNMHKGFLFNPSRSTLKDLKSRILDLGADIVLLQEVRGFHRRFAPIAQFEELADQVWPHFAYGQNAIYEEGHHGNAMLSLFPFVSQKKLNLSNHSFEQRGLLYGAISIPEWDQQRIHLATVHLDLTGWGRRKQVKKIEDWIKSHIKKGDPFILAGDFNDWSSDLQQTFLTVLGLKELHQDFVGKLAKTFPSWYPILPLDRIYAQGISVHSVEVGAVQTWRKLSDHLPLILDFSIDSSGF